MAITVAELDQFVRLAPEAKTRRLKVGDRLFLEVRRRGAEQPKSSWVLRYSDNQTKQSLGLGSYFPQGQRRIGGVTLAQAVRAAASKLLEIKAVGNPVKAQRQVVHARKLAEQEATANLNAKATLELRTVGAAIKAWHEGTKGKLTSDKYRAQRLRRLDEYVVQIGSIPVAKLTVADVADTFIRLGASDRAETFRRSSADLEKSIDYAAGLGWFDGVNPVGRARRNLSRPKQIGRRSFGIEKLPEFARAVALIGTAEPYPVTAHLLRLLMHTAARTSEIRLLRWTEVAGLDGDNPMLHIPAERMKRRMAWSVPLSMQAVHLLRELRDWQSQAGQDLQRVGDGYVFVRLHGNYKGRLCSENAVNDRLSEMGWADELVAHGLRKVFSTVAYDSWPYHGANRTEAIEFSLAHVHKDKIRGTYDTNDFMSQRRELMRWWSEYLQVKAESPSNDAVATP
jgi:integrase